MSYNADPVAAMRQIGSFYVAKILKGAKPADLPGVRTGEVMRVKDARTRTLCMDAVRDWLRLR